MNIELTNEERLEAVLNAVPQKPKKYELGGDYYFKCHWAKCDADVNRWQNYCDQCGQRIDWSDERE